MSSSGLRDTSADLGIEPAATRLGPEQPAPRTRDYEWMAIAEWRRRCQALRDIPLDDRRRAQVLFIGDSIVEGWDDRVWNEFFAPYHPLRLGVGGDQTENVLYRIEHGELEHVAPKVVVLLIGTNNLGNAGDSPESTARGVSAVVRAIRARLSGARLLLLGVLPREQAPEAELRRATLALNHAIAPLGSDPLVHFLDLGGALLAADGTISTAIMADYLHPTGEGYRRMALAMAPVLKSLVEAVSG